MPSGTVDVRVDDEWSFAETLRHLVPATDLWLGREHHRYVVRDLAAIEATSAAAQASVTS